MRGFTVFRVATYNLPCLHSTTQSHFWGNIGDGHMGTLKKNWLRTFQNNGIRKRHFGTSRGDLERKYQGRSCQMASKALLMQNIQ